MKKLWPGVVLLLLVGCTSPAPTKVEEPSVPPAPAPAEATPAPAPRDGRALLPDPTGRYIADIDRRLRVVDYTGREVIAPEIPGDPVQFAVWSPQGDFLVATAGKPTAECCELLAQGARYWLISVPGGDVRELTGLPQEVLFSWSADETSLYVLDNWRRVPKLDALGERIQRYDLGTGQLALLLDRQPKLMSVKELSNGDLLVGQYGGGGHGIYYRLAPGSTKLVTAAPFHMTLSPDQRWAAEGNLFSHPELAIADVQTGAVTRYEPGTPWPKPTGDKGNMWATDPVWDEESRWLFYTISPNNRSIPELRFFDRLKAEPERVVPDAQASWIPGRGVEALVLRYADGSIEPWRYDVAASRMLGPVGPKVPETSEATGCVYVRMIKVASRGETAAYSTCKDGVSSVVFVDLTGGRPAKVVPLDTLARILSLSADGQVAALALTSGQGDMQLRLINLRE